MFAHHNPELTLDDLADWCAAYIDVQQLQVQDVGIGHALWWAIERTMHVGPYHNDPAELEELWHFILAVLERQPPEKVLDILAAAPLEDLLEYAPTSFLSRAEIEAHRNPYFRGLLMGVWLMSPSRLLHWQRMVCSRLSTPILNEYRPTSSN